MNPILVDNDKCIGCGSCVSDCVAGFLSLKDGKIVTQTTGCIRCGHCYAICPVDAVTVVGMQTDNGEVADMAEVDSEHLLQAMKSRRTIRQFKPDPVEPEKLHMILEAGRFCPTGTNSQDVAYTILGSRQDEIEAACVSLARKGINVAGKVVELAKNMTVDDHFFFKSAPLVIVVSGKSRVNAALASSYMEIMAESLGLGVLYSGFFVAASSLSPKVKKLLELPAGHKPITCMVIGYPKVKYKRVPGRNPAQVKTL